MQWGDTKMSVNIVKRRGRFVSNIQKKLILKYLQSNPILLSPKFSENFKFRDAQLKWTEMANMLNRVPGGKKDWRHWRKTWHDMRSKTKLKLQQGGSVFSKTEKDILRLIRELQPKGQSLTYDEVNIKNEDSDENSSNQLNLDDYLSTQDRDPLNSVLVGNNGDNVIIEIMPDENISMQQGDCNKIGNMLEETNSQEDIAEQFMVNTDNLQFEGSIDRKIQRHNKQRSYYERKLNILYRIAKAKEKSAAAKERIAEALEKLADSRTDFL